VQRRYAHGGKGNPGGTRLDDGIAHGELVGGDVISRHRLPIENKTRIRSTRTIRVDRGKEEKGVHNVARRVEVPGSADEARAI